MQSDDARRFRCPEDVLDRDIGDDLLVCRALSDDVFVLNEHARLVFEAAKGEKTRGEVRAAVAQQGFASDAARDAIDRALDELVEHGILTLAEP